MADERRERRRVRRQRRVSKSMRLTLLAVGWTAVAIGLAMIVAFTIRGAGRLQTLGAVYLVGGTGVLGAREWMSRRRGETKDRPRV